MRVLSTLALSGVVQAVAEAFGAGHGVTIDATFLPTAVLMPRLRAGEAADLVLLTAEGIDALVADGLARAAGRQDLVRSFVGVAVRAGAERPDIATSASFVAAMRAARSIGLSRQGASGLFLAGLWPRLGIADAVLAKAVFIESGYTAELAADGRAELALQQVSELMTVPGVDVVGRLPPVLGGMTVFSGAIMTRAADPAGAGAFLQAIAAARDAIAARGLESVGA